MLESAPRPRSSINPAPVSGNGAFGNLGLSSPTLEPLCVEAEIKAISFLDSTKSSCHLPKLPVCPVASRRFLRLLESDLPPATDVAFRPKIKRFLITSAGIALNQLQIYLFFLLH